MSKAKHVMMRPKKDIHYFEKQKKHSVNFIIRGSDVKVTVVFRKEEIPSQTEFGLDLLNLLADELSEIATVEAQPTLNGRNMTMIIKPGVSKAVGEGIVQKSSAEALSKIGNRSFLEMPKSTAARSDLNHTLSIDPSQKEASDLLESVKCDALPEGQRTKKKGRSSEIHGSIKPLKMENGKITLTANCLYEGATISLKKEEPSSVQQALVKYLDESLSKKGIVLDWQDHAEGADLQIAFTNIKVGNRAAQAILRFGGYTIVEVEYSLKTLAGDKMEHFMGRHAHNPRGIFSEASQLDTSARVVARGIASVVHRRLKKQKKQADVK